MTLVLSCSKRTRVSASDQRLGPVQRPFVEQWRAVRLVRAGVVFGVVALDAFDLVLRAEDESDALVQRFRPHLEHRAASGTGAAARLLHYEADRIGLVK